MKKETQNDDAEIRLIISNERKVIIAKTTSSNEIITDREKTIELFKKGYKLETVCKAEETAVAEAEILQKKAKLTAIAFFDDWFEIWAKDVWIDYRNQENKWHTKMES